MRPTTLLLVLAIVGATTGVAVGGESGRFDFVYPDRAALVADGWDFEARTAGGGLRNTEQTSGLVVSYDQAAHPGVVRIPADHGTLWGGANDTRNTLFRDLPADWTTIRLQVGAFAPTAPYQGACLAAYQDDDNYVVLCRDFIGDQVVEWWQETGGNAVSVGNLPSGATTNVRLRLDRDQATETLTAFVSADGGATWTPLPGSVVKTLSSPRLGVVVGGNASPSVFPAADLGWVEVGSASSPLPPALVVGPGSLSFQGGAGAENPPSQALTVVNVEPEGGALNWTASANQPWLAVSPGAGTAPSSVTVSVSTAGLTTGTYGGAITVAAPGATNSPRVVPVLLRVGNRIEFTYPDRAGLVADEWDFLARTVGGGVRDTEQTAGLQVSYDQVAHPGVIRIPADQGTLWGGANDTRNTLFRDLPADWTTLRLHVAAFVPTGTYQGACLAAYQDDDNYAIICRDFIGTQVVEWWQETGGGAVAVGSVSSVATANLTLRLDRESGETIRAYFSTNGGMAWTPLPGSVIKTLSNPRLGIVVGGNASPGAVPAADLVWVDVGSASAPLPPALAVSPGSLSFSGSEGGMAPPPQSLTISNTETAAPLSWTASVNQPWLSVSPGAGTAPSTVTVSVSTVGLTAGTYSGTVTVTAPGAAGSPRTVAVVLTLGPPAPPTLGVSPASLSFDGTEGADPPAQSLTVANAGGGTLNWSLTVDQPWLSVSPTAGAGNVPIVVAVSPSAAGLTAGIYNGTITVTAPGATDSPRTVPVTLTLFRAPRPHVDLSYGDRTELYLDGWDFLARTAAGGTRDTEQTTGLVVSYDEAQHPGVIRIPADQGTFWGSNNNTRNTLFRDLPADWTSIRLHVAAFAPNAAFQGACLAAYQDDDNYVILCRDNIGFQVVEWWREANGSAAIVESLPNFATGNVRLRIDRDPTTNTLTSFVSTDGAVTWTQLPGSVVQVLNNPRLGVVVGGNQSSTSFPAADLEFVEIATVSVPLPPALGATPTSLTFNGTQDGPDPTPQTLTVTNVEGTGTLSWTATVDQPWLAVSPSTGTAPTALSVSVSTAGLGAGTHDGIVTLSAPDASNSPRTVQVVFKVRSAFASHVSLAYPDRAALLADGWWDFLARTSTGGARDTEQTTGLVVSYDQTQHPGVIRIPADQGTLWGSANNTRNTLFRDLPSDWTSVRLHVAAFAPNGPYQGACLMAYQDDDNYVIVCRDNVNAQLVEWWRESGGTAAAVGNVGNGFAGNVRLRLDRNPSTETIAAFVSMDGGATWTQLPGSVVQSLTNPRLGIVVGGNTSTTSFPAADLAFVDIATASVPLPPALGVGATSLSFSGTQGGPNPVSQTVDITNTETSGGTLSWTAAVNQPWLGVDPAAGTAPSSVSMSVSTVGLAEGTYSGTVTVTAPGASGSPKVIPVTLTVTAPVPPALDVSPATLSFSAVAGGSNPSPRTLAIANSGGGTIDWTAAVDQPWLTVSPAAGTAPSSVTVSVSTAALTPGTHNGTIIVTAPGVANSPRVVPVSLSVFSLVDSGVLTVAVLVDATNAAGYSSNPASPGEFQRYPERYLEHLQIPYEVVDVATASPPADLAQRHLIIAGHRGLDMSSAWRTAIVNAVNAGAGFINLDWAPQIGLQSHIQAIFGATGSSVGDPGTTIVVPASVIPGGANPHYIAGLQRRFLDAPPGDIVYEFHDDENLELQAVTSTVLDGASGTVIARVGGAPLILARSFGTGRAVHFGTLEYLKADRFGFLQGIDDLFWRSLVWAAKKPFVVRGYPRLWALQMDDTHPGWASRVRDLYDPSITGSTGENGIGGPWKVTGYVYLTPSMPPGSSDRASVIADINAGLLQVVPHDTDGVNCGDIYWNAFVGPLTDSQWLSNLNAVQSWKQGTGGADSIPSFSRVLIAHCWDLSNNTGFDLWASLGFRYVTSVQKPGYQITFNDPVNIHGGQERPSARPFWVYEKPPKLTRNEDQPLFFADDYPIGSRAGLPSQNFFLFTTQFHDPGELRPDVLWPSASWPWTVNQSVDQFKRHTWRFWSSLAPMQVFTHDASNYELSTVAERRSVIQQVSTWLSSEKGRHVFMENMGDYVRARTKSVLTGVLLSAGSLTFTFAGDAATADGGLVQTEVLVFLGDDEGTSRTIPGFSGGGNFTLPVIGP
jgi:hypothetical protein